MKNEIVYDTEWIATDSKKEYPHGWGFIAPLVKFPQDADPAWCSQMCMKHLTNREFECIGAVPRKVINGTLLLIEYPKGKS